MTSSAEAEYDVVIVGARCSGAALAMLLARQGLRVLVLERGQPGSDTLSTLALMRPAVIQLRRWGLLPQLLACGTPPIRETTFVYPSESTKISIGARWGVDALFAPRRFFLDPILCNAATDAGATIRYHARVAEVISEGSRVVGVVAVESEREPRAYRAALVVGADGMRSTIARLVEAPVIERGEHATGVLFGFFQSVPAAGFEWHFGAGVSGGLVPTNDSCTLAFAGCAGARFRAEVAPDVDAGFFRLLDQMGSLGDRVRAGRRVERLRGTAGERGFMRRAHGPGWALVGDAGYFRDPITAHGISDALRDAEILASALKQRSARALVDYQAMRDDLSLELFRISDTIASHAWSIDDVKVLHRRLSQQIRREEAYVGKLPAPSP